MRARTGDRQIAWLFGELRERLGRMADWWPGETALDRALGAILVQGVRWEGAAQALQRLKANGFELHALHAVPEDLLAVHLASARFPRTKARRLQAFTAFVAEALGGRLEALRYDPRARERLLAVPGIGPETADAILTYAVGSPRFVVDAYARRVLGRLGLDRSRPAQLRARVETTLAAADIAEFHALLVEFGKRWCRKRPRCLSCPLAPGCASYRLHLGQARGGREEHARQREGPKARSRFPVEESPGRKGEALGSARGAEASPGC